MEANLYDYVNDVIISLRDDLYRYRQRCPEFFASLEPLPFDENAPAVVQKMLNAGIRARVGPMAAVAGALSVQLEKVGHYRLGRAKVGLAPESIDASLALVRIAGLLWGIICFAVGGVKIVLTT